MPRIAEVSNINHFHGYSELKKQNTQTSFHRTLDKMITAIRLSICVFSNVLI